MTAQPFEASGAPAAAVVQITLGEVFNEVRQMHQELRDLNGSLSPIRERVGDHESRLRVVEAALPDHLEKRLGKLEVRQALWTGGASALSAAASWVIEYALFHH